MKQKRISNILKFADNVIVEDSKSTTKYRKNKKIKLQKTNKKQKSVSNTRKTKLTNRAKNKNKLLSDNITSISSKELSTKVNEDDPDVEKHPDGFIKLKCSPKIQENDFTCYSNESLMKLKSLWNARHPDVIIKSNEPREIWASLKEHLKNICNKESCWLKQNFASSGIDKEMLNYTFAPKSPDDWKKNPNEWLNSIDIENVMKQYEKEFPYFDFIGAAPIDFDSPKMYGECVWEELCHFDLNISIRNGKNKIGFIFNTDPHYLSGSHWISMFVNLKQKYIFFFDSTGNPPPKEVKKLIKKITEQGKAVGIDFRYIENNKHHQKKPTECGMYSLFMIINLLRDVKKPEDFIVDTFPDEEMQKFRKLYFNSDL
jgi:hypothetical protein